MATALPVRPLPSAKGWMVSNWMCAQAAWAGAARRVGAREVEEFPHEEGDLFPSGGPVASDRDVHRTVGARLGVGEARHDGPVGLEERTSP